MNATTMQVPTAVSSTDAPTFKVLGVRVDAVQIPDAIRNLENWIECRDA